MDYPQQHIKPYNEDGKKTEQVERMFDNIAHAYDKLNHTLSLGIDRSWRRKLLPGSVPSAHSTSWMLPPEQETSPSSLAAN